LTLSGHVDVLPPPSPGLWPSPPYSPKVDPDGVSGWGGLKAGLIAMLGAVRAIKAEGLTPLGPLRIQAVPEEETGGNGTLAAALSLPATDAALVAGCAGPTFAVAQFGVAWLKVHVQVPPCHASEFGDDGSAISKALQVSHRLRGFADELRARIPPEYGSLANPIGFNMGVIQGGTAPSMTAGECVIRCRIGFFPGMTLAELLQGARDAVASFAQSDPVLEKHPPVVSLDGFGAEPFELDPSSDFVRALLQAHSRAGGPAELVTSTTATDTRVFAGTGVPAACVGPVVENLHGIEERVLTQDLVQSAKVVALLVAEWVGLHEAGR
jgi:acetylornithine deacetylase